MNVRRAAVASVLLVASATACSGGGQPKTIRVTQTVTASPSASAKEATHQYASAQAIADALAHAGFTVSMLHKETDETYISDIGGTAWNFTVTDKAGSPAPGDAGINMFPNDKALDGWTGMSQGLGGVAVTGDVWAVSLPTDTQAARADSIRIAPRIAKTLGGTVKR